MQIKNHVIFNFSILIDESKIKEIVDYILTYTPCISIQLTTTSSKTIKLNSVEELIQFDNFDKYKINAISFIGSKNGTFLSSTDENEEWIMVDINGRERVLGADAVVTVNSFFLSKEQDTLFNDGIEVIIKKMKTSYHLINRILSSVFMMGVILVLALLIIPLAAEIPFLSFLGITEALDSLNDENTKGTGRLAFYFLVSIFLFLCILVKMIRLYPTVVFYTGEGIKNYDVLRAQRKLFFGLLIGVLSGLLVNYISVKIF